MLDKLGQAIQSALPEGMAEDVKKNVDAAVRSNIERMNLVTREQFEIQEKVLQRTRQRVEELEKQIKELEARIDNS